MSPDKENKPDLPPAAAKLEQLQSEFTAHIRDPDNRAIPAGVEDRRMKIYRDLFFNNIKSLLSSNFPVLRTLYTDEAWQVLVRDFYRSHRCRTPLFPEVAKEFLRYLQDERHPGAEDPAFLLELAHYEWVELALELDERELDDVAADEDGDLLSGIPVLSPLAWPLSYRFPVHRIKPEYQPHTAPGEATHILVYRNRDDDVKFMQLNAVTSLLLQFLQENPELTGLQLLNKVATAIQHPDPDKVVTTGNALLADLKTRNVLLGTRRIPDV